MATQLLERLEFLGHNASLQLMQPYVKWLRCFKGMESKDDPMTLVVQYLDSMKVVMEKGFETENTSYYLWARFNSMTMSYYFGRYDLAYQYSDCCCHMYEEHNFGATLSGVVLFWECMVFLATHRQKLPLWRRRYILSKINLLHNWSNYAHENLRGKLFLVEAEYAIAVGAHHSVPSLFFSAILHLRQSGLVIMEALANERAGKYFSSRGEVDRASLHLEEAIRLYTVWGSHSKVNHLQTESLKLLGDFEGQKQL
jgi:hypothetical protein